MKLAALEKERLENRQRTYKKFNDAQGYQHKPKYFKKWLNPSDNQEYWIYNE